MRLEQDFIEKVREANNLVEIIGQHTTLKGRGDQHMGLCPFPDHKEKTPSFSVSESKQVYHCFGCKKSGNLITFLEEYNGFSFMETVEFLARRAGIEIPTEPAKAGYKPQKPKEDRTTGYKINRYAAFYYFQNLKNLPGTHKAKIYLEKRGIPQEICEEFRLGYATEEWDGLIKYFQQKKAPMAVVEQLGLVRKNKNNGFFDLFRDRIMYPIFSLSDEVVGFGGRIIDEGQPKYINSVESSVFKKGKIFYGLNRSVRSIRSEDRVFIVEGYMDYLALYAQGITNVVATLGTALTPDHVKLVKRWTKTVVLLFDGDQAGQSASERSLQNFFEQGVCPLIMTLEDGMDPDDYLKAHGKEGFLEKASGVEDLFLVTLGRWLKGYRGLPKEKVELLDRLKPLLASLPDQRLRTMYIDEVAQRLGESPRRVFEWLKTDPANARTQVREPHKEAANEDFIEENQKVRVDDAPADEVLALALAIKEESNLVYFLQEDLPSAIYHTEIRRFFAQIVDKYGQQPTAFDKLTHFVVSRVENPEKIFNLINISTPNSGENEDQRMVRECLYRVKDRHLKRLASVLASEIKSQPSDEKLEQIMNIQKDRLALKRLKDGVSQESSSHGESN